MLFQAWLWDEKDNSVDSYGGRVGLVVSNREDLTVSGVILKVNLQELNMFKE